jgi:hypothetical protein
LAQFDISFKVTAYLAIEIPAISKEKTCFHSIIKFKLKINSELCKFVIRNLLYGEEVGALYKLRKIYASHPTSLLLSFTLANLDT